MLPRVLIDSAEVPGGGTLKLWRRGDEFSIMLGANELMNSRLSGSERALAELTCKGASSVLIGGLGMGFTLRAALAELGPDARVVVAELVPQVVAWARGPMADLHAGSLDDPRVAIVERDVARVIDETVTAYDAILLDVDNGPDGLTQAGNDWLYQPPGLRAARRALRSGGVLAVWSSGPDARFTKRLRDEGFSVEEVVVRANGARGGARHVIWLAVI